MGAFDEMAEFCRKETIDLIIVTLPQTAEERILQLMKKLWELPIDVRISAHQSKLRLRPRAYSYIGDVPFLAVFDKPLSDWGWAVKEIEDRVIAAVALLLLSPVMLAVAAAVRFTSKGPVLFRQKRHGFNNQLVEVYKFRSMFVEMSDANGTKLVTKGDPRVTPVGRFIRKTSLDELPQLFNVLKGELSLVGPRPHATACRAGERLYQEVVDGYSARHRMKPGITGLAQIHGWRGETDTEEKLQRRVEYDIHYIDNWSIWMDLYILAMTPVSLLNAKNAY
jgi:Undecaprenyl-phosphate glucose phosphotransferase